MHVPSRVIRPHAAQLTKTSAPEATTPNSKESKISKLELHASSPIPTEFGEFQLNVFTHASGQNGVPQQGEGETAREHIALVYGNVRGKSGIPVRVHSECMTSEVFGSLKCDCKAQLEWAMAEIVRQGAGAILYLRQEGRGIGLANKIRAYELQARGHDTVDANRLLGLPDDARHYDIAADMLDFLGVESIKLLTNNPEKVRALQTLGVKVDERVPVVVEPNAFSASYLETKRLRMAHELPDTLNLPLKRAANGK
jgi:GTP cyclohydrolase II